MRFLTILSLAALALAGCAQTSVTSTQTIFGGSLPRPKTVVVTDFVFSSDVVALDRGFTARLSRKLGEIPPYERKQRTAERVNDEIVATIVATLRENGLEARPGSEDTLTLSDEALIVGGRLRSIDQGNRTRRNVIGFGAGRSNVTADMTVQYFSAAGKKPLMSFTAEAQSNRRPGAVATAPIGIASSAAITAVAAAGGVASEKLSADVEAQARALGHAAAAKIIAYAREQGWLATPAAKPEGKPTT